MCLIIKENQQPIIAKKDIICYKIVNRSRYGFRTYYQNHPVHLGITYHSTIAVNYVTIDVALHNFVKLSFIKGFINRRIEDGIVFYSIAHFYKNHAIIKCIIPKGSVYYLGFFERDNDSYASNKLEYCKEISLKTLYNTKL